jgi:hypothetical protein
MYADKLYVLGAQNWIAMKHHLHGITALHPAKMSQESNEQDAGRIPGIKPQPAKPRFTSPSFLSTEYNRWPSMKLVSQLYELKMHIALPPLYCADKEVK